MKALRPTFRLSRVPGITARATVVCMTLALTLTLASAQAPAVSICPAVSGNINPNAITINGYVNSLSLSGSPYDWVKDALPNTDPITYNCSIATGVDTSPDSTTNTQTGAAALGHWNGVRIVDRTGGDDLNIFLNGGKENNPDGWIIGPGSIGSGKYDIGQCYIANNQNTLFFATERLTNSGTTENEVEFNQLQPHVNPQGSLVPTRSTGDVLVAFQMQGSGSQASGTGQVYIAVYNAGGPGTGYVLTQAVNGVSVALNQAPIPCEPWGYVGSKGWTNASQIPTFQFGEIAVDLNLIFPGINLCNSAFYTMVRSRSSISDTADLKDATDIFTYKFAGPTAQMALGSLCGGSFTASAVGSTNSLGGTSNLTYQWTFSVPAGTILSGSGVQSNGSGGYTVTTASPAPFAVQTNAASATEVDVSLLVTENGSCNSSLGPLAVMVYPPINIAAVNLTAPCSNAHTINFSSTVTGGNPPLTFTWTFYNASNVAVGTSSAASGSFNAPSAGSYYAILDVKDSAGTSGSPLVTPKPVCDATAPANTVTVYDALTGTASLSAPCSTTLAINFSSTAGGGNAPYTYGWQFFNSSNQQVGTASTASGTFTAPAPGAYHAVLTITDTADPASGKAACQVSPASNTVNAYAALGGSASLSGVCDALSITYSAQGTGGNAPYSYAWQFFDAATNQQVGTSATQSGTFTPAYDGSFYATVTISDSADATSGKGVCTFPVTTNTVQAEAPMNPQATKGAVSADGTSVTLNGTVHAADSTIWQVADTESATNKNDPTTATFSDIAASANNLAYLYGGFQTDDPDPQPITFQLNGVTYKGLIYTVYVRLKTTRTLNGITCVDYSNVLTISQIVATDPTGHGHHSIK